MTQFSFTDQVQTVSGNTSFQFSFVGSGVGYFSSDDIVVLVDGVSTAFTLVPTDHITISPAPAVGAKIRIRRILSTDAPYTDFSRGNAFGQENVNKSFQQQLYVTHQYADGFKEEGYYEKQNLSMGTEYRITDLAPGIDDTDAITVGQLGTYREETLAARDAAEASATLASTSADAAVTSAGESESASVIAVDSKDLAVTASAEAIISKDAAVASASAAGTSEGNANVAAGLAASSALSAGTDAGTATTKAAEAVVSADAALVSKNAAGVSAGAASTSASNAALSEGNASTYASNASTSESNAGLSATASSNSAVASADSAAESLSHAQDSATNAGFALTHAENSLLFSQNSSTSADASEVSKLASSVSATASATSEGVSTTKAGEASASAATATTQAGYALTHAQNSLTFSNNSAASASEAAQKVVDCQTIIDGIGAPAGTLYFHRRGDETSNDEKTLAQGVWTPIQMSVDVNSDVCGGCTDQCVYTAPITGLYQFAGLIRFNAGSSLCMIGMTPEHGTQVFAAQYCVGDLGMFFNHTCKLSAGEHFGVQALSVQAGTLLFGQYSNFSGYLIQQLA